MNPYQRHPATQIAISGSSYSGTATNMYLQVSGYPFAAGVIVSLTPGNDFGTPKDFLIRWYRSFGFIPNIGRRADNSVSGAMIRFPRKT